MASLIEIRRNMAFNKDMTSLMGMLSAVTVQNYYKLEYSKKQRFAKFLESFSSFIETMNLSQYSHPLFTAKDNRKAKIIITSDFGFMGGLNRNLILKSIDKETPDTKYFVIGEKGVDIMLSLDKQCSSIQSQEPLSEKIYKIGKTEQEEILRIDYNYASIVADLLIQLIKDNIVSRVEVAYAKSLTFSTKDIVTCTILPCGEAVPPEFMKKRDLGFGRELIVESDYDDMVEYLARMWTISKLMEILEDSKLAEFSARGIHLQTAQNSLEDEAKKLDKLYIDTRKELIDKQNRETFSAVKVKRDKDVKRKRMKESQKVLKSQKEKL